MMIKSLSLRRLMSMSDNSVKNALTLPGTVYGLGTESENAARNYAALSGREYRRFDGTHRNIPAGSHDVVVCLTSDLTPELMYSSYVEGASKGAPGFIFAPTSELLQQLCLKIATRLAKRSICSNNRVFLYSHLNFQPTQRGDDLFFSGETPREVLLNALSSNPAILHIVADGGGIDLLLSPETIACPFTKRLPTGILGPACQASDRCRRLSPNVLTVKEAWESGNLVSFMSIQAELLLLSSCSTVRFNDGVTDPMYSTGAMLLQQSSLGAVISTWRNEYLCPDGSDMHPLLNSLKANTMIGEAVSLFNHSSSARSKCL